MFVENVPQEKKINLQIKVYILYVWKGCKANLYRGQTTAVGQLAQTLGKLSNRFVKFGLWPQLLTI